MSDNSVKIFGGKKYAFIESFRDKELAEEAAKYYREIGWQIKIVKLRGKPSIYELYGRREG